MPCGGPPVRPCSSVSWSVMGQFGSVSAVADAGSVTPPYELRFGLLQDCSLKIINLNLNDARTYWCHRNGINSSVSLHIVEREGNILLPKHIFDKADNDVISLTPPVTESPRPADGTIELQCYLNTYQGHRQCFNRGIHIQWRTEHDTLLPGRRIRIENPSECFSKLIIRTKLTDHRRKWKCCLYQNETLKASITRTTTVRGKKNIKKRPKTEQCMVAPLFQTV